jgi:hypothetical protein
MCAFAAKNNMKRCVLAAKEPPVKQLRPPEHPAVSKFGQKSHAR